MMQRSRGPFRAMILAGSTSDNVSSRYPNRALLHEVVFRR
jgi:hypothetical protein